MSYHFTTVRGVRSASLSTAAGDTRATAIQRRRAQHHRWTNTTLDHHLAHQQHLREFS
jgi:hypothetical protein